MLISFFEIKKPLFHPWDCRSVLSKTKKKWVLSLPITNLDTKKFSDVNVCTSILLNLTFLVRSLCRPPIHYPNKIVWPKPVFWELRSLYTLFLGQTTILKIWKKTPCWQSLVHQRICSYPGSWSIGMKPPRGEFDWTLLILNLFLTTLLFRLKMNEGIFITEFTITLGPKSESGGGEKIG